MYAAPTLASFVAVVAAAVSCYTRLPAGPLAVIFDPHPMNVTWWLDRDLFVLICVGVTALGCLWLISNAWWGRREPLYLGVRLGDGWLLTAEQQVVALAGGNTLFNLMTCGLLSFVTIDNLRGGRGMGPDEFSKGWLLAVAGLAGVFVLELKWRTGDENTGVVD